MGTADRMEAAGRMETAGKKGFPEEELRGLARLGGPTAAQESRMRSVIHSRIQNRRNCMARRKRNIILAAAAIAVLGAGTALASGKISYWMSKTDVNAIDFQTAKEVRESGALGAPVKAPDAFADGTRFEKGYEMEVTGFDENDVRVGSYQTLMLDYEGGLTLEISRAADTEGESGYPVLLAETVEEIPVEVSQMEYLFLPADAEPSPEDQKRQEEGTLEIGYGSAEEERTAYTGAAWEEDGLRYHLFVMDSGTAPQELLEKAGEIIRTE